MRRTLVIWNPVSGRAEAAIEVREWLSARRDTTVLVTVSRKDAELFAQRGTREGYDLIVAAGGDGTVNAVANGLAKCGEELGVVASMGILPIGTANDFAFTLGLPDDLGLAAQLLYSAEPRPIDLIEIETPSERRCFANVAAGGNSNRVTESLTDEIKQTWGPLAYLRGAIGVLVDLGSHDVTIHIDEKEHFTARIWNMLVANGRTNAGRLPIAPYARPDSGLMEVILIRDGSFVDLAALGALFALSSYLESDQVIYRQARSFTLTSDPPMKFSIDGEIIEEMPTAFRVKPGAVKMIVGRDYDFNMSVPLGW